MPSGPLGYKIPTPTAPNRIVSLSNISFFGLPGTVFLYRATEMVVISSTVNFLIIAQKRLHRQRKKGKKKNNERKNEPMNESVNESMNEERKEIER